MIEVFDVKLGFKATAFLLWLTILNFAAAFVSAIFIVSSKIRIDFTTDFANVFSKWLNIPAAIVLVISMACVVLFCLALIIVALDRIQRG